MAKLDKYGLQTLLDIRKREKDAADSRFAQAQKVLAGEKRRKEEMEKELEKMILRREEKRREYSEKQMRGEMSTQAVIAANLFIDRLKEEELAQQEVIQRQERVIQEKERLVDRARQEAVVAHRDLKALDRHKEKWEKEKKRELQAKEEEAMDDLVQSMYNLRQR